MDLRFLSLAVVFNLFGDNELMKIQQGLTNIFSQAPRIITHLASAACISCLQLDPEPSIVSGCATSKISPGVTVRTEVSVPSFHLVSQILRITTATVLIFEPGIIPFLHGGPRIRCTGADGSVPLWQPLSPLEQSPSAYYLM